MGETIILSSGDAEAFIDLRGAELVGWRVQGADLLWQPEPAVWNATAPILFPVVGWTREGRVRVGGKTYPLGLHGFANARDFHVERRSGHEVWLRLDADEATKALYPFAFSLTAHYALQGGSLTATLIVDNRDEVPMPYACGLHPGFAFSWRKGTILFDGEEEAEVPLISRNGLFLQQKRALPIEGRRLDLSADLLAEEALCFLNVRSRGLTFWQEGYPLLRVDFDQFAHLALWARPPAPFLSIEVWTGHGDPEGFDGDLYTKPSMRVLRPSEQARHAVTWSFCRETV